ncbi:MAG: winged helix DNA-binding protein [Pseudomonadota bacterium]
MLDATTRLADRDGPSAAQNRARPSTAGASEVARKRQEYADAARKAYDVRRARGTIFGDPDLFGEPAWDILLDLYVAHNEGKAVSVSSACIGSASPPTTGLRWLGVLTEQGLVTRDHDPEDQRRVLVKLTDSGLSAMDRYFAEAVRRGVT